MTQSLPRNVEHAGALRRRGIGALVALLGTLGIVFPAHAAPGYYNGLKLPYAAGVARIVVRSTSHGPGRHAVDFGLYYEPVLAMYAGRVAYVAETANEGRHVVIDHGDGYCANYMHFDRIRVRAGQRLQQGEVLGISGNTGKSTGPHLHTAVYRKSNSLCSGGGASEVMMLFDEMPKRELRAGDWIVSRNGRPAPPYYPSVDRAAGDALHIKWNDYSNNEMGFKVERRTATKGPWEQVGTAPENAVSFQDSGLAPRTQYCYRLRAFNRAGDSSYSNQACATTLAMSEPNRPVATPEPPSASAPEEMSGEDPDAGQPRGAALIINAFYGIRFLLQQSGLVPPLPPEEFDGAGN